MLDPRLRRALEQLRATRFAGIRGARLSLSIPVAEPLLNEFRKRTADAAELKRLQGLIEELGHDTFAVREKAAAAIVAAGTRAAPLLRQALAGSDPERVRRAERCLQLAAPEDL